MKALQIYAGPAALRHLREHGLAPQHVRAIAGAAGGPKGLILGPLDRLLFGHWLPASQHPVDLIGASIGAWRMATACLAQPVPAFERLSREYIAQHYELPPGARRPSAAHVSATFGANLRRFFGGQEASVLQHPRYRLHLIASRGRHLLAGDGALRTPLGYLGAAASNALHRRALGWWLERVVFSAPVPAGQPPRELPFATKDLATRYVLLQPNNLLDALQASCSIPFALQAVRHIAGAPRGAYWDGGVTDYHLHLDYGPHPGVVLYPHFQRQVVPGWLDKPWRRRHRASPFLDAMLLLAPHPDWVRTLPNGKLPDRTDFSRYAHDLPGRMRAWSNAVAAAEALADEFSQWLHSPDPGVVLPL